MNFVKKNLNRYSVDKLEVEHRSTGYVARELQNVLHSSLRRFNVLVCHRRFGKTVFSINELIDKAVNNNKKNPQYAYISPTYKQSKMIAWDYIRDYTKAIPGSYYNKHELTVYIKRPAVVNKDGSVAKESDEIKIMLLGADNPDALRGLYLDGCILDEYAQCDPIIWGQIVRPALSDRIGWAIFIGTPKGQNHFYKRFQKAQELEAQGKDWFTAIYRASETGILAEEEMLEMKADMDPEEIDQELECSFTAALVGSYYGRLLNIARTEGRIGEVPYNPIYPVDTFWDLGIGDALTIWFRQKVGDMWHYIDYYENNGMGLAHYVDVIKGKGYSYGRHVIPHDGKAKDLGTGLTRQETLLRLGVRTEIQKKQALDDGIQASRNRLLVSKFDVVKCARGLECLQNYQREWDSKLMMFRPKPKHDWSSNGADGFRYSALDDRDSFGHSIKSYTLQREADSDYNELDGV